MVQHLLLDGRQLLVPLEISDEDLVIDVQGKGDANKTIGYIRSLVKKTWGAEVAKALRIQYGGSMKPSNAKELMAMRNIDGGLIGGAALKAEDFAGIVNYKG